MLLPGRDGRDGGVLRWLVELLEDEFGAVHELVVARHGRVEGHLHRGSAGRYHHVWGSLWITGANHPEHGRVRVLPERPDDLA